MLYTSGTALLCWETVGYGKLTHDGWKDRSVMPRLVKGAKWTYGWVVVGPRGDIVIPPQAWRAFGFQAGNAAIFMPGSGKSGGFAISTLGLLAEAGEKMGGAGLRELGRGTFCEGWVRLPPTLSLRPGDRLLTVRGSRYGLGFVARGPIYEEARGHPELEVFRAQSGTAHWEETGGGS